MTNPEFVTTELPSGLLKVEAYGRHGCEAIVEGVSVSDAEKFKAACSVGPAGHLRIGPPAVVLQPAQSISFPFDISFGGLDDFTTYRPVR